MIKAHAGSIYQKNKNIGDSEKAVLDYLPLVRYYASRLALGLPAHIAEEDLVQAGVLGLLEAWQRYDPQRGVKFETFAAPRIKGAMLDELRSLSWLPRSLFKQMRELEQAVQKLTVSLGREPEEEELAEALGISVSKLQKILKDINCSSLVSLEEILFALPADSTADGALEKLLAAEEEERLVAAIEKLPERYQQLLALYYQEGLTLKEIGLVLGVTESRVCQLHAQIISRLRSLLND
ncbi:MAG: FliA/WhiG family RNA polymerase sigma factor [Firmicutes bacterium]|nr:FliA/WhiG family RNA polymerase sigma factor [Bacillota bacterium]